MTLFRLRRAAALLAAIVAATALSACSGSGSSDSPAITPESVDMTPGDIVQFVAPEAEPVEWSVEESDGGTVGADGTYVAPDAEGTFHVVALSTSSRTTAEVRVYKKGVRVQVTPQTAALDAGASMKFTASVQGTSNDAVTWFVQEGAAGGSVAPDGSYTAPDAGGTFHVVARSAADTTRTGTATVTVAAPVVADPTPTPTPEVAVTVAPTSVTVAAGATAQFTATVTNTTTTSVTWSVQEGTTGGSVSSTGLYTAPSAAGTFHVVATSAADSTKSAVGTVTVTAPATTTPTTPTTTTSDLGSCTALISDATKRSVPSLALPGYSASNPGSMAIVDPVFKTKIVRVTGTPGSAIPNTSATWRTDKPYAGPVYAKDPPWNADQSLLAIKAGVAGQTVFLDGNTYVPRYTRANVKPEYRWHPKDPRYMIYVDANGQVGYFEPATNTYTVKVNPGSGYGSCTLGSYEGNVSYDGRWAVVQCLASGVSGEAAYVFFAVDIQNGTKYPTIRAIDIGFSGATTSSGKPLDWASISPLGKYIVASQNYQVQKVLTLSGSVVASLGSMGHYDLGLDESGNEVAYEGGGARYRRLSDGALFSLPWPTGSTSYHTSTRNSAKTGWGYTSLESATATLDGEIVAHELIGNGRIRRLADHRATNASYDRAAFAAVSPDGKRVLFRSDWGNSSGPAYGFVLDLRNVCP